MQSILHSIHLTPAKRASLPPTFRILLTSNQVMKYHPIVSTPFFSSRSISTPSTNIIHPTSKSRPRPSTLLLPPLPLLSLLSETLIPERYISLIASIRCVWIRRRSGRITATTSSTLLWLGYLLLWLRLLLAVGWLRLLLWGVAIIVAIVIVAIVAAVVAEIVGVLGAVFVLLGRVVSFVLRVMR